MKFDVIWSGEVGGDCTQSFTVDFEQGLTVKELVEHIITNRSDEWGAVEIASKYTYFNYSIPIAVYSHGMLHPTDECYTAVKDLPIRKIEGHGGYSLMEYTLYFNLGEDEDKVFQIANRTKELKLAKKEMKKWLSSEEAQ